MLMTSEDKYRKQAIFFLEKINEARKLFTNHKPSIGYVGEQILRQAIMRVIPHGYDICQGFILNKEVDNTESLSNQCDIIIFHKEKEAIAYSLGDLKIIDAHFVVAVIEVKSSIKKESLFSTLKAFETLNYKFKINNIFLFIFNSISRRSLSRWFFEYRFPENFVINEWAYFDSPIYDRPDIEWLPNAILSIKSNGFYKLGHLQEDKKEWLGYESYIIKDKMNKEISCLHEFFVTVIDLLDETHEIDINEYSIKDGFTLFDI